MKFGSHCPHRSGSRLLMEKRKGKQMVGDLILYLALIQLGTVTAITAAVVGALFLIYQSVPKWTPEICDGVDQ